MGFHFAAAGCLLTRKDAGDGIVLATGSLCNSDVTIAIDFRLMGSIGFMGHISLYIDFMSAFAALVYHCMNAIVNEAQTGGNYGSS